MMKKIGTYRSYYLWLGYLDNDKKWYVQLCGHSQMQKEIFKVTNKLFSFSVSTYMNTTTTTLFYTSKSFNIIKRIVKLLDQKNLLKDLKDLDKIKAQFILDKLK